MASQPIASTDVGSFFEAFIRGYHICNEQWEPLIGKGEPLIDEELLQERYSTNPQDYNAVAVKNASGTVGH